MATHGAEAEQRRHRDFIRTELMAHGERLREVEAELNAALRRLDAAERFLTLGYTPVQSGPEDH